MSISRAFASVLAAFVLVVGCAPTNGPRSQNTTALTTPSASEYILPAGLGPYTNVWAADPGIDLLRAPVAVVRAAVEAEAISDMVGRYDTYPGYGRLLDSATQTRKLKADINVGDTPSYPGPISLTGTKHYRLYDVVEVDNVIDGRICAVSFGVYQTVSDADRKPFDPINLRPVTDPDYLDSNGHIPAYNTLWRVRLERDPDVAGPPPPSSSTPPNGEARSATPQRYPNEDLFRGWKLLQFSYETKAEPRCLGWARDYYPMGIIGSKGVAYPTNPVDSAYLPTLPPYPGWAHVPAV